MVEYPPAGGWRHLPGRPNAPYPSGGPPELARPRAVPAKIARKVSASRRSCPRRAPVAPARGRVFRASLTHTWGSVDDSPLFARPSPYESGPMNATAGDRLLVHGSTVGERDRTGVIIEVRGPNGGPPYIVRFDDGHTALVFPGPDSVIVPQ
ncbi:DUF1918 domain-containing protein [Nonomuraea sp. NPDC049486]|uniref:DUF1918 domain-containing protein n=1 Tax=Nonomuraea sp. NPDC049486 TaxID=3155773 RepID=UPI003416DD82